MTEGKDINVRSKKKDSCVLKDSRTHPTWWDLLWVGAPPPLVSLPSTMAFCDLPGEEQLCHVGLLIR